MRRKLALLSPTEDRFESGKREARREAAAARSAEESALNHLLASGALDPSLAADEDFAAAPITLPWADGDSDSKTAAIPIVNEKVAKSPESFTVDLSNPTNGALIGPHSHLVVTVNYDYQPPPPPSGGGGAFDWFALLCLSCVRWLRRRAVSETTVDNTN